MKRLENKVAVITGAASGIGAATAKLFAREGAKVVIADLQEALADQTASDICQSGGEAIAITTDVTDRQQVQNLFNKATELYGCVNILHCNAGVLIVGSAETPSEEHWHKTLNVNLTGTYLCAKYGIPQLKKSPHSAMIITASVSGLMGEPDVMAYDTTKGGLINLTRQLAVEYAKDGIRVNSVCPGWIDTPFNDPIYELTPFEESSLGDVVPLARQGTPEEIATAVLFLASDEASYITGHNLVVDGGVTAKI